MFLRSPRHLLVALVLVVAQWVATAHAVDHALGNEQGLPNHLCQLCLTAHDLGAAAPVSLVVPPVVAPAFVPLPEPLYACPEPQRWRATQRGPPAPL